MKVLSLNINDFGGINCKKDKKYKSVSVWRQENAENFVTNSSEILTYIKKCEIRPDVVILHEFELDTEVSSKFICVMEEMEYKIVPYPKPEYKNSSVTVMFVINNIEFTPIKNPHKRNLRAVIVEVSDQIIYGVHCPTDMLFWDELISFYNLKKEHKVLIIGDLNVFDMGTGQKQKYNQLLNLGAEDAWIKKGYPHEKSTFNSGKRIDYAIMSPSLCSEPYNIIIDDVLRENNFTDHSAVIVEW